MGLKLNPEKWQLAVKRAAFLGHEISAEDAGTIKSHTEAVEKTVQPRTLYVRSWDWLQKICKNFAIITRPLHELVSQLTGNGKSGHKNWVFDDGGWTKLKHHRDGGWILKVRTMMD